MKIDKETFDFQMRLIRAEIDRDSFKEENERLRGQCDVNGAHIKYLQERCTELENSIRAEREYINRFIKPWGTV